MATLLEYFETDFPKYLNINKSLELKGLGLNVQILVKLHTDFDSNSKFLLVYVPEHTDHIEICRSIFLNTNLFLQIGDHLQIQTRLPGEQLMDMDDLLFSGRLFLYNANKMSAEEIEGIREEAKKKNISIQCRDLNFSEERSKLKKPHAFISHDSRDKIAIAKPIAMGLSKVMCPVWFDEFSLNVGDNLRKSIELGIKESKKCILILSKHFLSNSGWTKTEFDSIFTRELVEERNIILPVWVDVTKKDIYEYSPSLANKVAVKWSEGEAEVIRKIHKELK